MGVFEMVLGIVLITAVAGLIRARMKVGNGNLSGAQETRLARLEERVKALESVVGDPGYELKQRLRELES